jgi:hypothetical protein
VGGRPAGADRRVVRAPVCMTTYMPQYQRCLLKS